VTTTSPRRPRARSSIATRRRNDSTYNTGLTRLPAVAQPDVWYSYSASPLFPELGPEPNTGGIAPIGGPAYDQVPGNSSVFRFPNYYKGVPLFYEWSRD
jgi:cytochrome c